jgi:hypothetical protein
MAVIRMEACQGMAAAKMSLPRAYNGFPLHQRTCLGILGVHESVNRYWAIVRNLNCVKEPRRMPKHCEGSSSTQGIW